MDQAIPIRINTSDEESKDRSAHAIQMAAAQVNADFIFTIMEAWGLPKDKLHSHLEILERYGAIANSPYKIDTVSFALETRHGILVAQLPITPKGPGKKKRTFGPVTLQFVDGAEGRFAGLLPVARVSPSDRSPLHRRYLHALPEPNVVSRLAPYFDRHAPRRLSPACAGVRNHIDVPPRFLVVLWPSAGNLFLNFGAILSAFTCGSMPLIC